jgi:hypothetical protein
MKHDEQQKLADAAKLLRAWRAWHREQLETALTSVHADVVAQLMVQLKNLRSARELVNFIRSAVDPSARAVALHQIALAITALRERKGLPPFSDSIPWTDETPTAFEVIREILRDSARAEGEPAPPGVMMNEWNTP